MTVQAACGGRADVRVAPLRGAPNFFLHGRFLWSTGGAICHSQCTRTEMSASNDPPNRAISAEILSVQESISKVEREIVDVQAQITIVELQLKAQLSLDDLKYWRTKEDRLRAKEEQLRAKEEQLRVEKNILLQQSGIIFVCIIFSCRIR